MITKKVEAREIVSREILLKKGWVYLFSYKHFQFFEKEGLYLRWDEKTSQIIKKYKPVEREDLARQGWIIVRRSKRNNWEMFIRGKESLFWDPNTKEVLWYTDH